MQLVERAEWGAAAPRGSYSTMKAGAGICLHWYGGPTPTGDHSECAGFVRDIQAAAFADANHQGPYIDIPYNLLVCPHGYVFVGRGVGVESAAQGDFNGGYYAICALTGTSGWTSPTTELLAGIEDASTLLRQTGSATTAVVGHCDLMQTDCPGTALEAWVKSGSDGGQAPTPPGPPADHPLGSRSLQIGVNGTDVQWLQQTIGVPDDGDFGPQTQGGVMAWQHAHGLSNDGQVGPLTWAALGHPMA